MSKSIKLVIDPGHGGRDPGATGHGLREKDLTLRIALGVRNALKNYEGIDIHMTRETDKFVSLRNRTNMANALKADYFLSIHINAGGGTGFESFIFRGLSAQTRASKLRTVVHNGIMKEIGGFDRGKKQANFHVLRESNMSAMLTEVNFIDNKRDSDQLKTKAFIDKAIRGHVNGIVKAFGLKKKKVSKSNLFYRVVTGSFTRKRYADSRLKELKGKKIDGFITPVVMNGVTYYRVVTGSYQDSVNAHKQLQRMTDMGYDSFIDLFSR